MPIRPEPYTWVLNAFDIAEVAKATRDVTDGLGFTIKATEDAGEYEIRLRATVPVMEAAAEAVESDPDDLDEPENGERYALAIRVVPANAEDPRPRLIVSPDEHDNWAAWSVIGPLAEDIAEALSATDVTGDPTPDVQAVLDEVEPPAGSELGAIALRAASVFPRRVTPVRFGRKASVAAIDRLLGGQITRVALVIQRDPTVDALPTTLAQIHPIALYARVLKAVRQGEEWWLIVKGIERIRVKSFDGKRVRIEPVMPAPGGDGDHPALREFAADDPLVANCAGVGLMRTVEKWPLSLLADIVAEATEDPEIRTAALVEADPKKRAIEVVKRMEENADDEEDDDE